MSTAKAKNKLITSDDQPTAQTPLAPSTHFMMAMLRYADQKEAKQIVSEQAALEYDRDHGGEIEKLRLETEEVDARFNVSKARLAALEEKINATKQYIKAVLPAEEGKPFFQKIRGVDKLALPLIVMFLLGTLIMGTSNVFVNLMAAGDPIFIEKPYLALFIALLVPAGSTALKFISGFFETFKAKKRFALTIYILSALSMLGWSVAFALNFNGVSGAIDFDALGEGDGGKGALLVWLQLVAEILVAGALFLAAEEIILKYAPETYVENIEFLNAVNAHKTFEAQHTSLRDRRNDAHARLAELEAGRKAYVNERVAEYIRLRGRVTDQQSL